MLFAADHVIGTLSSHVDRLVGQMRRVYGFTGVISIDDQENKRE